MDKRINPMEEWLKSLPKLARKETLPEIPRQLRWKSKFFGNDLIKKYIAVYYQEESAGRIPFYLPYIYMKEIFRYLCYCGGFRKKQINLVLIDGEDARIDYFLYEFLEELNYLTIITERKAYFESLQERAFQELGLLIDLIRPWEEKNLNGNLVWDFSEQFQQKDCYPEGAVCFTPHKKLWKQKELLKESPNIRLVSVKNIEAGNLILAPELAESLLIPSGFPFRETRCKDLRKWCSYKHWSIHLDCRIP